MKQQTLANLAPKTINRAVKKQALQRPLTSYGFTACVLGFAYIALFGISNAIIVGSALVGALALGSWIYEAIIKGDSAANTLVQRYREQLINKRKSAIKVLHKELKELNDGEALKQLQLFEEKYKSFVEVLDKKLSPSELAYNRYLSIAEQVYLGGLDNLTNAAVSLQSVSAIDVEHIQSSLQKLSRSEEDETRGIALQERLELYRNARERSEALKLQNELALTNIDKVASKIATINTGAGNASVALEDSMEELKRLISRADQLSN